MDSKNIEQLLEKYWNCETTLEEEQQLRDYFRGGQIPSNLNETAELFRYFEEQRHTELHGSSFESRVMNKIKPAGRSVGFSMNIVRIAAGLAVVIAAGYFVRQEVRKSYPAEDTFSDPKIAFEETKKALMMISRGFGKGQREASKINLFHEAEQQIQGKQEVKKDSTSI